VKNLITLFKGCFEKQENLFKFEAFEEFYHRYIFDILESRPSLTGG